jgi:hypothetical protein
MNVIDFLFLFLRMGRKNKRQSKSGKRARSLRASTTCKDKAEKAAAEAISRTAQFLYKERKCESQRLILSSESLQHVVDTTRKHSVNRKGSDLKVFDITSRCINYCVSNVQGNSLSRKIFGDMILSLVKLLLLALILRALDILE